VGNEIRGERRSHFRGRSRPGRRVDLEYQRLDGVNTAQGTPKASAVTANIGVGGAFLLTPTPEPVGTNLAIALSVPDRPQDLLLEAEVRWVVDDPEHTGAGMGIKFAPLEVDALIALQNYFATLS
jgi:hypothetical protein